MKHHNLIKLWEMIRPIIVKRWPGEDNKPFNNVYNFIQDFQKLDRSGQTFRYSNVKDRNGYKKKFSELKTIDLKLLQKAFDEMWNFLDGCLAVFIEDLSYINEPYE
ncbi:MAG: hypothetical protein D3923_19085 [Candidatus Electrothrix sp. AR3]|nr:hypothetical protein [Candidatus Electrothrix sp. AR3]